ncbi:hypothetical protein ACIOHS_02050 [Streptomyces sp. NPDC088253]|uniref:hypothetical protein n=1 Tax=Streptomyces sp. NPDC088253 TaxID=3365846 RepID=UPI0038307BA2
MTSSRSVTTYAYLVLAQRRPGAAGRHGAAGGVRTHIALPLLREFGDKLAKVFP